MSHILIIDDSPSVISMVETALKSMGHQVTTAHNGKIGLRHLRQRSYDLVLTDLYMPEMDGLEVIQRMRTEGTLTRLIAISSKDSPVNMLPIAKRLGALQKPFTREELLAAVDTILELPLPEKRSAQTEARHKGDQSH